MPYYCTVPRCTSMAGKAKNVSFHQFPRDEELAKLWNKILKRNKPYTKYSKVCSLHFTPEDYTITSVGKNKGQWRSLRKDAIPSQNLPFQSPAAYTKTGHTGAWVPNNIPPSVLDPRVQQQMAQAIYMQTMLAMHAAGTPDAVNLNLVCSNGSQFTNKEDNDQQTSTLSESTLEQLLRHPSDSKSIDISLEDKKDTFVERVNGIKEVTDDLRYRKSNSYKCTECLKCFKDPDVFILHQRIHSKEKMPDDSSGSEKENFNTNGARQETLKANPILANLLKAGSPQGSNLGTTNSIFDVSNIMSIENNIMAALAVNMENYLRSISCILNPGQSQEFEVNFSEPDEQNANQESDSIDSQHVDQETDSEADLNESTCLNKLVTDENVS